MPIPNKLVLEQKTIRSDAKKCLAFLLMKNSPVMLKLFLSLLTKRLFKSFIQVELLGFAEQVDDILYACHEAKTGNGNEA